VGRYLVKVVSLLSTVLGFGCVLIRRQLGSFSGFPVLIVRGRLTPEPDEIPLAATDAHVRVGGRDSE